MVVTIVFLVAAAIAVIFAVLTVVPRNPTTNLLSLVVMFFAMAAIFAILGMDFLAAIQIIVYSGAVLVLFLFVIMLLNLGRDTGTDMLGWAGRIVMLAVGALLATELLVLARVVPDQRFVLPPGTLARITEEQGAVGAIAAPLFRDYLIPFEITSVLLLAAVVGAVVLAKRRL